MKTLVSIPDKMNDQVEKHKKEHYPDLTIPKILVRLLVEDMQQKESDRR